MRRPNSGLKLITFPLIIAVLSIILLSITLMFLKPAITGYNVMEEATHIDELKLTIASSSEYLWELNSSILLKSVRLSGSIEDMGSAKVYIENNGIKYLIFDGNKLDKKENLDELAGPTINNASTNNSGASQVINEIKTFNETQKDNKSIKINLEYKKGTIYDADDNGVETSSGVIDFTVENSEFNWQIDENRLCSLWETYSVDYEKSEIVCHGDGKCCGFAGFSPVRESWKEPFYSYHGLYGAAFRNIVSARILYVEYNLSPEQPYQDIAYSNWTNLSAAYTSILKFNDICIDTCVLAGFNSSYYKLILEINDTILNLDNLAYTAETIDIAENTSFTVNLTINTTENAIQINATNITELALVKDIPNITIVLNKNSTINLSQYFSNIDENTAFTYFEQDGVKIEFDNNVAAITPPQDFIGTVFSYVTASKGANFAVSNVFSISIIEAQLVPSNISDAVINITDPLVHQKLVDYAEVNLKPAFRYSDVHFTSYQVTNEVVIVYIIADGKEIKWLTSLNNFREILRD